METVRLIALKLSKRIEVFGSPKILPIVLFLAVSCQQSTKNIYVWPGNFIGTLRARGEGARGDRDDYSDFMIRATDACAKLGHKLYFDCYQKYEIPGVKTDVLVIFDILAGKGPLFRLVRERDEIPAILFAWEPPTINTSNLGDNGHLSLFDRIYVLYDDIVDHTTLFKFYEPQACFEIGSEFPAFRDRKLCAVLTGCKASWHPREIYSSRWSFVKDAIAQNPRDLDVWGGSAYGVSNDVGSAVYQDPSFFAISTYRGIAPSKLECYKNYKFAICYENMRGRPGYITSEKFMFCFLAGCVPVYWGAENITDYVPPECFIDRRDFASDAELYAYLRDIYEVEHAKCVDNARRYMKSAWSRVFSHNNFIDIFIDSFDPAYNRSAVFTPEELNELRLSKLVMKELGHLTYEEAIGWELPSPVEPSYRGD